MAVEYKTILKYGPGHDAPWTTITSDNEEEHTAALGSLGEGSPMWAALGRAQAAYKRDALLGEVLGAQPVPSSQLAGGFTAPPAVPQGSGEAKYCSHGMRNFKSGTNKNGKPYSGYFCTANQCPPEWG